MNKRMDRMDGWMEALKDEWVKMERKGITAMRQRTISYDSKKRTMNQHVLFPSRRISGGRG